MRALPVILAMLCAAYYGVIVSYSGLSTDFAWIWPALAAALMLTRMPLVGRAAAVLLIIGAAVTACLLVSVIRGMRATTESGLAFVIVEGAQVRGKTPSRALRRRCEAALDYARENPDTIVILSGGQGCGEQISEAQCMKEYLTQRGIPPSRLVLEDRSASTRENLLFSDELTGCGKRPTGLITNDFHICRSLVIARHLGYEEVFGIPAKSDAVMQVHFTLREVFALALEYVRERADRG